MSSLKRRAQQRKVFDAIRKMGRTSRPELITRTGVPRSTVYHCTNVGKAWGVVKELEDGDIAWIDYQEEDPTIESVLRSRGLDTEKAIQEIAERLGVPPETKGLRKRIYEVRRRMGHVKF